jgi:hypothetical protein
MCGWVNIRILLPPAAPLFSLAAANHRPAPNDCRARALLSSSV